MKKTTHIDFLNLFRNIRHADHIKGILSIDEFSEEQLQEITNLSKVHCKCNTDIKIEGEEQNNTEVYSLRYGDGDLSLLSLIANSKKHENKVCVSTYPLMKGYPISVKIEKVVECDNLVEATVFASIKDFKFAFFATDYYVNKKEYIPGNSIVVDLAALGVEVDEARISFRFNGEDATNWYKKIGQEVTYNEYGDVSPVNFDEEKLVVFLPLDANAPDEALFQSPASMLSRSLELCDFGSAQITIHEFDSGEKLNVPLFFQNDPMNRFNRNVPLRGNLWLTGFINGKHTIDSFNICPKIATNFVDIFDSSFMYLDKNLMYVLDFLPDLEIKEGFILNFFYSGSEYGKQVRGYCHQRGSTTRYIPFDDDGNLNPYHDSMRIEDLLNWKATETVPPTLPYFKIPFTESGIMQAWILSNIEEFLPRTWHALYSNKYFIFDEDAIEDLFPESIEDEESISRRNAQCGEKVRALDRCNLLPIIKIHDNTAVLEYAYWNDWKGLVKKSMIVNKENDSVSFQASEEHILVDYNCGIIF